MFISLFVIFTVLKEAKNYFILELVPIEYFT